MTRQPYSSVTALLLAVLVFVGLSVAPAAALVGQDGGSTDVGVQDGLLEGVAGEESGLLGSDGLTDGETTDGVTNGSMIDVPDDATADSPSNDSSTAVTGGDSTDLLPGGSTPGVTDGTMPEILEDGATPSISTDDAPPQVRELVEQMLASYPETDQFGPEDVPVGDEEDSINTCEYPITPDGLPLDAIPWTGALPDLPVEMPGAVSLLNPADLSSLLFGYLPPPCDVFQLNDPQIDPTDPPDEPYGELDIARLGQEGNGSVLLSHYEGTLNESAAGPGVSGTSGLLVTPEYGDVDQKHVLNDGRNDYGVDNRLRYDDEAVTFDVTLILVGDGLGVEGSCERPSEYEPEGNLQDNPLGPCEYTLKGLPSAVGPTEVMNIIYNPGISWEELFSGDVGNLTD